MPDHEVMIAELVKRTFVGKRAVLNGRETRLSRDDVEFIAAVSGDHENIEKEEGRSRYILSSDPKERAKALFFIADTLTGVLVEEQNGGAWRFDESQLEKRFIDLYVRHLDPVVRKIFRPEWGAAAVADLTAAFAVLEGRHGCRIRGTEEQPSPGNALARAALTAISRTLAADAGRREKADGREPLLGAAEREAIEHAAARLRALAPNGGAGCAV